MSDIYAKQNPMPPLSLEERLTVTEILLETLMLSAFEKETLLKRDWAEGLRTVAQVSAAHRSLPEPVLRALTAHADRLVEIDHYADWLKASLRLDPDQLGGDPPVIGDDSHE
jgi:hypothetical protein